MKMDDDCNKDDLWEKVKKSAQPLKHRRVMAVPTQNSAPLKTTTFQEKFTWAPVLSPSHSKHMRTSRIRLEGRIDLHGLTRLEAEQQMMRFLNSSQHNGKTWVLVITGKGQHHNPQTLRALAPQWLNSWPIVSAYMTARPQDGGSGALYVRLKRLHSPE